MSTRSYIAKQVGENEYRTIFCHFDGYPEHVGAILLDAYNTPEKLDELLELGDIDVLGPRLSPDPNLPHNGEHRQKDVTLAYARDMGEKKFEAEIKTLEQLEDPGDWIEFVYIFDQNGVWNYLDICEQFGEYGPNNLKKGLEEAFPSIAPNPAEGYHKAITDFICNQDPAISDFSM